MRNVAAFFAGVVLVVECPHKAVPPIRRTGFPGHPLLEEPQTRPRPEAEEARELNAVFSHAHPIWMTIGASAEGRSWHFNVLPA